MNYKVLYRKYRPTNFDEIVGQNNVTKLLKDSINNSKIAHAYIFSGPRGTGKTSAAKVLAKAANCLNPVDGNPCNSCENCLSFNQSSDVYEIDAASNNGVDQVRELIENIKLMPLKYKYKVYIIDEVHMLSTSAFNALLLTLEEPPSHVIFILATTNIESVPITVLSRCQRMDFKKISKECIEQKITQIAELEKIDIDKQAISEIADYSEGGLRDALGLLDQLSKTKKKITANVVRSSLGTVSAELIKKLIIDVENSNIDKILEFIKELRNNNADFTNVIKNIILAIGNVAAERLIKKSFDRMSYSDYKQLSYELSSLVYKANVNIDSYALLEMCLLSYTDTKIISREIKVIKEMDEKKPNNSSKKVRFIPLNRVNNCFVDAKKSFLESNRRMWQDFKKTIKSKKLIGVLSDTEVVLSSETIIVLKTDFKENADVINEKIDLIEGAYKEYNNYTLHFVALSEDEWKKATDEYKENVKNGKKYETVDEYESVNDSIIDDVFETSKIERK